MTWVLSAAVALLVSGLLPATVLDAPSPPPVIVAAPAPDQPGKPVLTAVPPSRKGPPDRRATDE